MTTSHTPVLLFDVDGTLLQPRDPLHTRAFREALADLLGPEYELDLRGTSGMLDRAILAAIYHRIRGQRIDAERLNRACRLMATSYLRGPFDDTEQRVLPGVRDLLSELSQRAVPMGIVTGNIAGIAKKRLARAGINHHFQAAAYGSEAMRRPTLLRRATTRLSQRLALTTIHPRDVIVIGDTPRDIIAAHAFGARCLAVASGDYSLNELETHRPDQLLGDLTDLVAVLESLGQPRSS